MRPTGRRRCLRALLVVTVACGLLFVYSFFIEVRWLKTVRLDLSKSGTSFRLAHITDIHYKGDRPYLQKLVERVNALQPDFVCFTGDLVESRAYLTEALEVLGRIEAPLYAVPGNHEHWSACSLEEIDASLSEHGGRLLVNEWASHQKGDRSLLIVGVDDLTGGRPDVQKAFPPESESRARTVLVLTHSPALFDRMDGVSFALGLAGHSHGGQVRLPLLGAIITPGNVGPYERGLYQSRNGPVYVNPGIGTWNVPARLMCRPEITSIRL